MNPRSRTYYAAIPLHADTRLAACTHRHVTLETAWACARDASSPDSRWKPVRVDARGDIHELHYVNEYTILPDPHGATARCLTGEHGRFTTRRAAVRKLKSLESYVTEQRRHEHPPDDPRCSGYTLVCIEPHPGIRATLDTNLMGQGMTDLRRHADAGFDATTAAIDTLRSDLQHDHERRIDERLRTVEAGVAKIDQRLETLERAERRGPTRTTAPPASPTLERRSRPAASAPAR